MRLNIPSIMSDATRPAIGKNKQGGLEVRLGLTVCVILVLYLFSPEAINILYLVILVALSFLKPSIAVIVSFCTVFFDRELTIPFTNNSIAYLIYLSVFIRIFIDKVHIILPKRIVLLLSVLILWLTMSTYLGFLNSSDFSGFGDPTRGIIFILGLVFAILCLGSFGERFIYDTRSLMWIIPVLFIISSVIGYFSEEGFTNTGRFAGLMVDPNYFSRMGLISLCILLFEFHLSKILRNILILFTVSIILLSYSKTSIIVLLIVFSVYFYFEYKSFWPIALVGFLVIMFFAFTYFDSFDRFDIENPIKIREINIYNPIDIITSGRTFIWVNALREFFGDYRNVLFGIGIGAGRELVKNAIGVPIVLHNGFLDLLVEAGTIGSILLFSCILYSFRWIKFDIKPKRSQSFIYMVITLLLFNMTLSGFWTKQNLTLIMLCMLLYGKPSNGKELKT